MKNKLKLLVALFGTVATTAAFGQAVHPWTGGNGTGIDVGAATNWSGGLPVITGTGPADVGEWDGSVPGNLFLTYNGGLASGFGNSGVSFSMSPAQTGNVNIASPVAASVNLAVLDIVNNSANAAFTLGNTSANVLNLIWRPGNANQLHNFLNNSASANIIYPNVKIQSGGGVVHVLLFDGTGDWKITNNLICANSPGTLIQKTGSGTLYWGGPSITAALGNGTINSPITIAGGTLVLMHNTVLSPLGSGNTGSQAIQNNGTLFKYDAPGLTQILTGVISGGSPVEVANGTLTLSGANTYTGETILSGGTLVVNRAETEGLNGPLGVSGTVSFTGGTLQFSANNTYDYSPRFSTAAGQAYKIDSGGQNVLLTNDLASSGGTFTKLGAGTLTLSGVNSFSGLTTVSAGKLVLQGAKTGVGNITVASSAALGVGGSGTQVTPGTLTAGGGTLEFNNVSSTTTAPLAASTLTAGGTITVNVNSGSFAIGQSYPLFTWTSGSAPAVTLGTLTGAGGNLSTNGNKIQLNITSLAFVWTGNTDANWDTSTANNWNVNGVSQIWANGGTALFDDSVVSANTNVILNAPISPASVTVSSSTKPYSITASGANVIAGSGSLTKNGNSTLTLAGGVNTYGGATTISGGTLSVGVLANGGSPSDIGQSGNGAANLVLNGGTLQYTGAGGSSDRLFTLGTAGGTFADAGSGALVFNNTGAIALSGTGARGLTLTGADADDNTIAAVLGDNGGATSLTKSGAGKWVLTGNNTYSGGTTIAAGTLQVGTGASGSLGSGNVTDNGSLIYNLSSTLTNGTIGGTGSVTKDGSGTLILPGDNSYSGGTTITAGTLQVGNGGATGKLNGTVEVVNNGTFIVNSTGSFTLTGSGLISGAGNVIVRGAGGLFQAIGANTYTGWTLIESGATFQPCQGNQGALVSSVVTNNGTLKLVRQDTGVFIYAGPIVGTGRVVVDANNANNGDVTFTGTNTYTGGTLIQNNILVLGDGATPGAGTIVGNVLFTNSPTPNENPRRLTFNHPEDLTFSGNITYSTNLAFGNRGVVQQQGAGVLTLTGTNDYPGGTVISNGVVQVGNGGTSGAIGTGPVTDETWLVFNRADAITFGGVISGAGAVVKTGAGSLTLTATNTYFGALTVSNGSLFINGQDFPSTLAVVNGALGGTGTISGPITMDAGTTLVPGAAAGAVGILTAGSDLTIGGNVVVEVNKALAQSNDLVMVSGTLSKTGAGTLTVANIGPALTVGNKFTLFSQPVTGGAALTVTGGGATWQNDLAVDGSITVLTVTPTVNPNPPAMQVSVSGNTLSLAWPTNLGWTLQTNSVGLAAAGQWFTYPGSTTLTNVNIPINPAKTNVFFRMVLP